jgi:Protein of unknown function (DUF2380)
MRFVTAPLAGAFLLALLAGAHAEGAKAAVFDLEFFDSSLEGELKGPRPDEQERLARTTEELRRRLAASGRYHLVDTAALHKEIHGSNLQACGGCDLRFARELGADLAITGVVQKVSNLILNINIFIRDAHTGKLVDAASADMRGNTDESWARALAWLLRNRLLQAESARP